MTDAEIRQGYLAHAAKAQFYRWYQYYEEPRDSIGNQLDILDGDVALESALGEGRGHDAYLQRVAQIPKSWKNAHFVQSVETEVAEDGIQLTAEIIYLNVGMLPDGALRGARLRYDTALKPVAGTILPKFTNITIKPVAETDRSDYASAYPENRVKSLVHYWLTLIEDPKRDPGPVQEILAPEFSLNFSSGAITEFDGFKEWLAGPASQVAASTHWLENFAVEETGPDMYRAVFEFDWEGILTDDSHLVARTRHTWTVMDDPTERFARIKTVDVEVLEPFRPKE